MRYKKLLNVLYTVLLFLTSGRGAELRVSEVVVNRTNYQGCHFDEHFIQCQTSTYISGIVNEFVQCDHNYFQYVYIPILLTNGYKNII